MKLEKLQIKHLVYQNYKPLMAWNPNDKVWDLIIAIEYDTPILSFLNSNTNCLLEHSKLALKPLSKLSNEELIPIGLLIRDIEKNKATYKDNIFAVEDAKAWIRTGMKPVLSLLQVARIMEYLYSIHADIFGLLDANLAIDINSLNK